MKLLILYGALILSLSGIAALNGSNTALPDKVSVNKVSFLMAHNANTVGWLYNQQTRTVTELLTRYGVRGLKIHLHWYTKPKYSLLGNLSLILTGSASLSSTTYIALCHEFSGGNNCKDTILQRKGSSPRPATEIFSEIVEYLNGNPKEVLIIRLDSNLFGSSRTETNGTQDFSDQKTVETLNETLESTGLARYAFKLEKNKWPTLGQMRSSGKRVLIFSDEEKGAASPYINAQKDNIRQSHWEDDKRDGCKLSFKKGGMFEVNINYKLSIDENTLLGAATKFINLFKKEKLPTYDYQTVNDAEAALLRLNECEAVHGQKPNIIASDHVDQGNLLKLVDHFNEELLSQ